MYWNKRYTEIALETKLPHSAVYMWQWIIRQTRGRSGAVELRIDLKKFNKYIGKHRYKPYDPKTLKYAMNILIERLPELLVVMEKVTNYYYILLVRPASYLNTEKDPKPEKLPNSQNGDSRHSKEHTEEALQQQQQCIEYADQLFNRELKLRFDGNALTKIAKYCNNSKELILKGYQYIITRYNAAVKSGNTMFNPAGYLITAFRHNVIGEWNLYYDPAIPQVQNVLDVRSLTDAIALKYGVSI